MSLQRSKSATLQVAGRELSHIPKRATQHTVFLSGDEVQPVSLKVGVRELKRQMYTEEADLHHETYLDTDNEKGSQYQRAIGNWTIPDDYKNPRAPIRQKQNNFGCGHQGSAHWRSESHSSHNDDALEGSKKYRQFGPSYRPSNPPTCVGRGEEPSSYQQDFGKLGHNPTRLVEGVNKNPVIKSALTYGTCKGTKHIPGYQGYLSQVTPLSGTPEPGGEERTTFDKTNLHENFHVNLVGYLGHIPLNARNDNGGRKVDNRTTFNKDYPRHPIGAFD